MWEAVSIARRHLEVAVCGEIALVVLAVKQPLDRVGSCHLGLRIRAEVGVRGHLNKWDEQNK